MPRRGSKVGIIAAYVAKNPDATWKDAETVLKKRGISSNYFATQRSKLKSAGLPAGESDAEGEETPSEAPAANKPKRGAKRGRPPKSAAAATGAADLKSAAEFARNAGGLSEAKALLEELSKFQV